jgi:hypothetical protein
MICPLTDKICTDPECKEDGCLEQEEEDGHEANKKDADD